MEADMTEQTDAAEVCDCAPDCAERIACTRTDIGHAGCGWCDEHEQARHLCYCPRAAVVAARGAEDGGGE